MRMTGLKTKCWLPMKMAGLNTKCCLPMRMGGLRTKCWLPMRMSRFKTSQKVDRWSPDKEEVQFLTCENGFVIFCVLLLRSGICSYHTIIIFQSKV